MARFTGRVSEGAALPGGAGASCQGKKKKMGTATGCAEIATEVYMGTAVLIFCGEEDSNSERNIEAAEVDGRREGLGGIRWPGGRSREGYQNSCAGCLISSG